MRLIYHNYIVYMFILGIAAGVIGGGLVAGLVLITTALLILLYAIRWYRLKHSKADPAMADDIQMTQNDVYTIAAKIQGDGNRSCGGTLNNDVCDVTYDYINSG